VWKRQNKKLLSGKSDFHGFPEKEKQQGEELFKEYQ